MAFQQSFSFNGIDVTDGYIKVSSVAGGKTELFVQLDYSAGPQFQAVQKKSVNFVPDMEGGNFIKQAYQFLKTLPEFSDAVDC
jgi:hypothetical protein